MGVGYLKNLIGCCLFASVLVRSATLCLLSAEINFGHGCWDVFHLRRLNTFVDNLRVAVQTLQITFGCWASVWGTQNNTNPQKQSKFLFSTHTFFVWLKQNKTLFSRIDNAFSLTSTLKGQKVGAQLLFIDLFKGLIFTILMNRRWIDLLNRL